MFCCRTISLDDISKPCHQAEDNVAPSDIDPLCEILSPEQEDLDTPETLQQGYSSPEPEVRFTFTII